MATVIVDQVAPGVTRITLNRPEKLNAMNAELIEDLHDALDDVAIDRGVPGHRAHRRRTGILRGTRPDRLRASARAATALGRVQVGFSTQTHIARLVPTLRSVARPVIAAVNGPAAGGGLALALGSDIRIAGASARFNVAFVRLSGCRAATSASAGCFPA